MHVLEVIQFHCKKSYIYRPRGKDMFSEASVILFGRRGFCLLDGICFMETPVSSDIAAIGTHPTGMHSSLESNLLIFYTFT